MTSRGEELSNMEQNLTAPSVHHYHAFGAGPLVLVVPAGEAWEILSIKSTYVTTPGNLVVTVDGRVMLWGMADQLHGFFHRTQTNEDYFSVPAASELGSRIIPVRIFEHQVLNIASTDGSGFLWLWYRKYSLRSGLKITDDGFTNGRNRTLHTWGHLTETIGAGVTAEYPVNVSDNPYGVLPFPWEENAPAQRDYELLAFLLLTPSVISAQITVLSIRILHEGRELIRDAGVPLTIAEATDLTVLDPHVLFPLPPYLIGQYEALQTFITINNGTGAPAAVTFYCGYIMIERERGEVM